MPTFVSYRPFYYGSWDDAARAHNEVGFSERARPVMANSRADTAFNPAATREAIGQLTAPVLLYGGELDADPAPEARPISPQRLPD
jgi:hypothetical protein